MNPATGKPRLILASASPRRRELCERFFPEADLQVVVPEFDDSFLTAGWTGTADQLAAELPVAKLCSLNLAKTAPEPYCLLAADTMVVLDQKIIGKPADRQTAEQHLKALSGRTHRVLTGLAVAIWIPDRYRLFQAVEETRVHFKQISPNQISWYLDREDVSDKAGSYAIQGLAGAFIEAIDGCYYNVMGLPVARLFGLLAEAG